MDIHRDPHTSKPHSAQKHIGKRTPDYDQERELLLSLRFIGFEVAQLYADADSVFAVEKIHKWYVAESIQRLGAGTGLTLADLQGYLLGRPTRAIPQLGGIEAVYDWNPATGRLGAVGFYRNGLPAAGIAYETAEQTPTGPTASGIDSQRCLARTRWPHPSATACRKRNGMPQQASASSAPDATTARLK